MNKVDNGMKYFSEPDIFGTFQPAPERIKTNVMNRLLPSRIFKYILFPFLLLVLSPLLVLFIDPIIVKDSLFIYFIATISILICVYSGVAGIFLACFKSPYIQELKNKLGYLE